ncbi:MAG: tripartite tricarboxylate transporter permease [Firmicutes bacterium]|nr:tripartite tricarboxylate transporter permease [Bacillota bacterium]MCL5039705.1 tripartite tricarboxylate transporter permease [Bacillota bacterium]
MLENLVTGFALVAQWQNVIAILAGSVLGYLVGALPGLSAGMAIALLLPFTFNMPSLTSLVLLTALYGAAEYGGSITAVTINVPGEAGSTPTTFDGYPLTKKGFPAKALGVSIVASAYAGILSTVALILISVPLARIALSFGPPEYFALGIFGLTMVASLGGKSWIKGFISVLFGLLITTIGIDPISGTSRFTFTMDLFEGIPLIPVLVGLFAISEVLMNMEEIGQGDIVYQKISGALPSLREYLGTNLAMLRGTIIGFIIGIIPGAGKAVASFIAYSEEKRASKHPELFGTGVLEGVAAPEAANNAVVSGALVPLLALGIPGSAAAAILIGAFTIQGLQPGPLLFVKEPDLVYGLFASLLVGNIAMLAMGLFGTQLWAKVVAIPKNVLTPIVLAITLFAAYAESNTLFSVWLALFFGLLGYLLRKYDFPVAPIVLAVVLGEMIETSFRRALILSDGSLSIFVAKPIALAILLLATSSVVYQLYRGLKKRK